MNMKTTRKVDFHKPRFILSYCVCRKQGVYKITHLTINFLLSAEPFQGYK